MIKSGDIAFVHSALSVALRHLDDPDTREDYEVVDVLAQAIDCLMTIEDAARDEGVLE